MQRPQEKYFNQEEAARYLGVRESDLDDMVSRGELTAYKLGGKYVRFKKEELECQKAGITAKKKSSVFERMEDFLYFNSFYISAIIIIVVMLLVILKF